jgi:hypothetical protein
MSSRHPLSFAEAREKSRKFFRYPAPLSPSPNGYEPYDPHMSWLTVSPTVGFLKRPPPEILCSLPPEPVGRCFTPPNLDSKTPPASYCIASLRSDVNLVPPHPGNRPTELDLPSHPHFITSDGSSGAYDRLRYPQNYETTRPWGGFHTFVDSPETALLYPANSSTTSFFNFQGMQSNLMGGNWIHSKIVTVYERREKQEVAFWTKLQDVGDPEGISLQQAYGSALPYFDSTEPVLYNAQTTWASGREPLASTLRYIAELTALSRWLHAINTQRGIITGQEDTLASTSTNTKYIGVWVGTVPTLEEWWFLWRSPLPLYGLFKIPDSHPLRNVPIPIGHFHGDEVYRDDAFAAKLRSCIVPDLPDAYGYHTRFGIPGPHPPVNHQPLTIDPWRNLCRVKTPMAGPSHHPVSKIGSSMPYTTYLFLDTQILRSSPIDQKPEHVKRDHVIAAQWRHLSRMARSSLAVSTGSTVVSVHPIELCVPPRLPGETKQRYFYEQNEGCFHWPMLIGFNEAHTRGTFGHQIHVLSSPNTFLVSPLPWPSNADSAPPTECEPDDSWLQKNIHRRIYIHHKPSKDLLDKVASMICREPHMDCDGEGEAKLLVTNSFQESHFSLTKLAWDLCAFNPPPVDAQLGLSQHPIPAARSRSVMTEDKPSGKLARSQLDHRARGRDHSPRQHYEPQNASQPFTRRSLHSSRDQSPRRRQRTRSGSPRRKYNNHGLLSHTRVQSGSSLVQSDFHPAQFDHCHVAVKSGKSPDVVGTIDKVRDMHSIVDLTNPLL